MLCFSSWTAADEYRGSGLSSLSRELAIGRLRVQLGDFPPDQGRAFGNLLAKALGERPLPSGPGGHLEKLRVELPAVPGETPARLATRVADALLERAIAEMGAR
jgi:hypothetical protein